ncbi:unnamed protein product [Hymenolepis diminuta]|uniref:BTB domain-containing protein n=1 Tax=Hymenolepis diminuta TaxID=6216 RepID=A0A564XYP9_HYMDI|nr:unnamed protein product [Hymenolepis diminuta]
MMEINSDYVIYTDERIRRGDGRRFQHYRKNGKYFDLKIVTNDSNAIEAHRVILATRFPILENSLPDEANDILKLERFSNDIVEEVLSYAYSGRVRIDLGNVIRLFLLALNLECSCITDWCIDFLRTRVSPKNIIEIWSVANATLNEELIEICIPVMRANFQDLATNPRFCTSMEPDGMALILSDPLIDKWNFDDQMDVEQDPKLKALSIWLNNFTSNEKRVNQFQTLLGLLDMCAIQLDIVIFLHATAAELKLPKFYRDQITRALKQPRRIPAGKFCFSDNTLTSERYNQILVFGSSDPLKEQCIIANVPQIQSGFNVKLVLPYRNDCSVVLFRSKI